MRLKTLAIISSLALASCAGLPPKPSVELCVIDIGASVAYCNMTNGEKITKVDQLKYQAVVSSIVNSPNRIDKPIKELHKYISFSPMDWGRVVQYMHSLEYWASQKHCH